MSAFRFEMIPQLAASDVARARDWYFEKLGVEPVLANQEPHRSGQAIDADTELFYDTGSARFGIYRSDNAGTNRATAVRLVVDDFDAAYAELVRRRVVFVEYDLDEDFRVDGSWCHPTVRNVLVQRLRGQHPRHGLFGVTRLVQSK